MVDNQKMPDNITYFIINFDVIGHVLCMKIWLGKAHRNNQKKCLYFCASFH